MRATLPNPAKENAQSGHVTRIKGLERAVRNVKFNVLQRAFAASDATDAETNDRLVVVRTRINLRRYAQANPAGKTEIINQRRDELLSELGLPSQGHERVVFQIDLDGWAQAYLDSLKTEYDIDL